MTRDDNDRHQPHGSLGHLLKQLDHEGIELVFDGFGLRCVAPHGGVTTELLDEMLFWQNEVIRLMETGRFHPGRN